MTMVKGTVRVFPVRMVHGTVSTSTEDGGGGGGGGFDPNSIYDFGSASSVGTDVFSNGTASSVGTDIFDGGDST